MSSTSAGPGVGGDDGGTAVPSGVAFVERLASRFPGLRVLLDEHRVDNLGEVLPHVFFGDLTRYVVRNVVAGNRDEVQSLLDELEVAIGSGDEYVENLVAVSFLENLPRPDEEGAEVRSRLGRRLRAELAEMER